MFIRYLSLIVVVQALVAGQALAQDSMQRSSATPLSRPVRGLYVRAGLGFSGLGNNVIRTQDDANGDKPEATVTGMGLANEITLGAAVSSSWVLGGGLWGTEVFATDYTPIRGNEIPLDLQRPETFNMAALFADWHFAPQLGVHGQAGLGVAALTSKKFNNGVADGSRVAFGPGIVLGLGIDIWGDPHWAIGVMARMNAAATFEKKGGLDYVHGVVTPALLITVCYNE